MHKACLNKNQMPYWLLDTCMHLNYVGPDGCRTALKGYFVLHWLLLLLHLPKMQLNDRLQDF